MRKGFGPRYIFPILIGRLVRAVMRARGGGSAFPGYVVNRLAPGYLSEVARQVPGGVVFVLGSNGKSTTTHMITDVVRAHGQIVFTNRAGANLPQGVTSSLLSEVDATGALDATFAILEVDEGFAVSLAKVLRPSLVTMLNVQVDQLYRFYETDRVADMMMDAALLSTSHVVTNREDPYLSKISKKVSADTLSISYFGATACAISSTAHGLANAEDFRDHDELGPVVANAEVIEWKGLSARIVLGARTLDITLPTRGFHYALDAAAALQTVSLLLGDRFKPETAIEAFRIMRPAYGRGEILNFGDEEVEMTMFKNAASIQLNLDAFETPPEQVMIAIDEGTPDLSWIYDVDFSALDHVDVLSGSKCWQVALRLAHEGIPVHHIEPELTRGIEIMRSLPQPSNGRKAWFVNYEQMMEARKLLGHGDMEDN